MQGALGLIGEIDGAVKDIDWKLVRLCRTEQEAMRLCINQSRVYMTQEDLSEILGMSRGTLNTILNSDQAKRQRYMPRVKQIELQRICGNRAIDQWAEMYEKGLLSFQTSREQRREQLLRELEQLEIV